MTKIEKYLLNLLLNGKSTGCCVQIVIREATNNDVDSLYSFTDITEEIKQLIKENLL